MLDPPVGGGLIVWLMPKSSAHSTHSAHLPIGQFATATQLSIKALHHYDQIGLLIPDTSDRDTGYRYYSHAQIQPGRLIRLLRDLDIPLQEMKRLIGVSPVSPALSTTSSTAQREAIQSSANRKLEAAARHYAQQRHAYAALLAHIHHTQPAQDIVVIESDIHTTVALTTVQCDRERLRDCLEQSSVQPLGISTSTHPLRLGLSEGYADATPYPLRVLQVTPQITTAAPSTNNILRIVLPENTRFANLMSAHDTLFDWLDREGQLPDGQPCLELHHDNWSLIWKLQLRQPPQSQEH